MLYIFILFTEVTSIRSGLRKRKRPESPQSTEPQVTEEWVDEDKLELWEIKQYGDRYCIAINITLRVSDDEIFACYFTSQMFVRFSEMFLLLCSCYAIDRFYRAYSNSNSRRQ